ncbi:arginyltransferase [Pikeienuella piscinae]|uniref:Aspartate/glutamate leucyltransferase n=1 Tax=Pikeienuella piscinae TaxID=2748098 RepID=A0A7L5BWN1_9RHOB|nr:arginyltransferase [Pikeienuella piscinae]QIE53999.1 arginyltransferase [Pikeienuella piscinae]
MTHLNQKITAQFFLTANQPCPYLPGRQERKLFTTLRGADAREVNDALSLRGFRRSQSVAYRPACSECGACLSVRVPAARHAPTASQRRILKRNAGLERRTCAPWATEEQYELFRAYLQSRHADGGMAEMDICEFASMIEETTVRTRVIEYHDRDAPAEESLVAACLTDVMADGLSMVYSFFRPELARRSLGVFMILDHLEIARQSALPYLYLGYWVPGSRKMDYKARFTPLEFFRGGEWRTTDAPDTLPVAELRKPDPFSVAPD